jgi:uncharacterized membrane protein YdbT with pleckstrin-like domain
MGYVDKNLIQGETVVYRGSLSPLPYLWPLAGGVLTIAAAVLRNFFPAGHRWLPVLTLLAVTAGAWLWARIRVGSAEFAVTNRRVMIKQGIMQRQTLEIMLSKVEGISVDQGIMGRLLNFGTITVIGTGGTRETYDRIARPLEFRRQIQGQFARMEDDRLDASRTGQRSQQ